MREFFSSVVQENNWENSTGPRQTILPAHPSYGHSTINRLWEGRSLLSCRWDRRSLPFRFRAGSCVELKSSTRGLCGNSTSRLQKHSGQPEYELGSMDIHLGLMKGLMLKESPPLKLLVWELLQRPVFQRRIFP